MTTLPNFEGCGHSEHRTVGPHRAWCHDCSEWCYPDAPCARGELVVVLAALEEAKVEVKRLRRALERIVHGEEEAPVGMSNPAAVAREALEEASWN